jgi:hypothetical protein
MVASVKISNFKGYRAPNGRLLFEGLAPIDRRMTEIKE